MDTSAKYDPPTKQPDEVARKILIRLGRGLRMTVPRNELKWDRVDAEVADRDLEAYLYDGSKRVGIALSRLPKSSAADIFELVAAGHPIACLGEEHVDVFERVQGSKLEGHRIGQPMELLRFTRRQLDLLLPRARVFVARNELECDSMSARPHHSSPGREHADAHSPSHSHATFTPVQRFFTLLDLDRRDIRMLILFALVAGILALATPLAIESLVNVVSWGTYLQPLIVLALMLFTCMGLAGILKVLQTLVVETIQRRQFVRLVGDLAHRFPRANPAALTGEYPRELANRVFDILTIQKATATLLLDGVNIVLTTSLGLLLLAFYHPFLLGFDLVLSIAMIGMTWTLGHGGIRTAIEESITKYKVVHWLQDVIAAPTAFKIGGGESLAVQRANELTAEYIQARQRQFRVVIRQVSFAIGLQVIASTAVLGLGGWLVIQGQLTLGQLVASELVVTTVVGAFAKAGKSLETLYDLMAAVDKVGHLLDIPADDRVEIGSLPAGPARASWSALEFAHAWGTSQVAAAQIECGSRIAIVGDDLDGGSLLAKSLAGLAHPSRGEIEVAGFAADLASMQGEGNVAGYAGGAEVFHGTLGENVDLGRPDIGVTRVRECLDQVGLAEVVRSLPHGVLTTLQTDGHPLTRGQIAKLVLARAMAGRPRLLIVDRLLDELSADDRSQVWQTIAADEAPWTLLVTSNHPEVAALCTHQIAVRFAH